MDVLASAQQTAELPGCASPCPRHVRTRRQPWHPGEQASWTEPPAAPGAAEPSPDLPAPPSRAGPALEQMQVVARKPLGRDQSST